MSLTANVLIKGLPAIKDAQSALSKTFHYLSEGILGLCGYIKEWFSRDEGDESATEEFAYESMRVHYANQHQYDEPKMELCCDHRVQYAEKQYAVVNYAVAGSEGENVYEEPYRGDPRKMLSNILSGIRPPTDSPAIDATKQKTPLDTILEEDGYRSGDEYEAPQQNEPKPAKPSFYLTPKYLAGQYHSLSSEALGMHRTFAEELKFTLQLLRQKLGLEDEGFGSESEGFGSMSDSEMGIESPYEGGDDMQITDL